MAEFSFGQLCRHCSSAADRFENYIAVIKSTFSKLNSKRIKS